MRKCKHQWMIRVLFGAILLIWGCRSFSSDEGLTLIQVTPSVTPLLQTQPPTSTPFLTATLVPKLSPTVTLTPRPTHTFTPTEAPKQVKSDSVIPTPTVPQKNRQVIAYIGSDYNVWLVSLDDNHVRQLTTDADPDTPSQRGVGGYSSPAWSPDGGKLYFIHMPAEDLGLIFVYEWWSGDLRSVGPQGEDISSIAASPDGNSLAYIHNVAAGNDCFIRDTRSCLAILDLETGASTDLMCDEWCSLYGRLSFSPNGKDLAFHLYGHEDWHIGFYSLNNSELTVPRSTSYCLNPEYTPDGNLLWAECSAGFMEPFELYIVDLSSAEPTLQKAEEQLSGLGVPVMSTDGTYMAFVLDGMIIVMNLATEESWPLIEGMQPAWRPFQSSTNGSQ